MGFFEGQFCIDCGKPFCYDCSSHCERILTNGYYRVQIANNAVNHIVMMNIVFKYLI